MYSVRYPKRKPPLRSICGSEFQDTAINSAEKYYETYFTRKILVQRVGCSSRLAVVIGPGPKRARGQLGRPAHARTLCTQSSRKHARSDGDGAATRP